MYLEHVLYNMMALRNKLVESIYSYIKFYFRKFQNHLQILETMWTDIQILGSGYETNNYYSRRRLG